MQAISLMYHDICEDPAESGFQGAGPALYKLTPDVFKAQLDAISEFSAVKPGLVTEWDNKSVPVFFTFDDGGKSALKAADMLEMLDWRGHFFVTTGEIGNTGFVNAGDIVDLHRRGHIIGSHSDNHPLRMAHLGQKDIREEWRVSLDKLSQILGGRVAVASVPGGLYSRKVGECAAENEIRFLFNSEPKIAVGRIGSCMILGRHTVRHNMQADEVLAIASGKVMPRLKQSLTWNLKKPLKMFGGRAFLELRRLLIDRNSRKG